MTSGQRNWRPKALHIFIVVGATLAFAAFTFAGYRYQWQWAGFNAVNTPQALEYQPAKTLWDWMQLLIVPVALALGGLLFNRSISKNEQNIAQQRDQTALDIASDNQREALLQDYLDRMSSLLLEYHLLETTIEHKIRNIARARTLTVLARLDANRKGSLLQFLYESDLISKSENGAVIRLKSANLSRANLSEANLSETNLSETNLSEACLFGADLRGADLSGADLSKANLLGADLSQASLKETNLSGADLRGADLRGSNLSGADLSGGDLRGADLWMTDLHGADLRGATIDEGSMSEAEVSEAIFASL